MFDVLPLQQSSSWMTLCWFTSVCVSWSFHVWVFVLTAWQHEANRLVAHPVPAVLTVFFIVTDRKSCMSCQRFWPTRVMNLSAALVFSASSLCSLVSYLAPFFSRMRVITSCHRHLCNLRHPEVGVSITQLLEGICDTQLCGDRWLKKVKKGLECVTPSSWGESL